MVEIAPGRLTQVGSLPVRRVLPQRPRRTVGSWCFLDHAGPVQVGAGRGRSGIGPHPHMGLQTVTWLLAGELLHLDSLGSEQLIRPGQLNLMTAGHGVSHAEEDPARSRGGPCRPALGGAARRHPRRACRPSSITPSCRASSSTTPRRPCSSATSTEWTRRRGATPSTWGWSCGCAAPARRCRCARTTSTRWWSWRAGSWSTPWRWSPACWPISGQGREQCQLRASRPGACAAARRRALPRTDPHVVELRRAQPRGGLRGPAAVVGRRRALRPRPVLAGANRGGSSSLGVTYQSPQPGGLTVPVMPRGSTGSRVAPAS